jgi:phage repressor protein C with HTH and peptisase S24 domain
MSSTTGDVEIGARLKALRDVAKGGKPMSQGDFAESLGLSLRAYQNYERGERPVSKELIRAGMSTYGWSADWLLFGEGEMFRTPSGDFGQRVGAFRNGMDEVNKLAYDLAGLSSDERRLLQQAAVSEQADQYTLRRILQKTRGLDADAGDTLSPPNDFVLVPRYDVKCAAGHGAAIHSEQIVDYLAFRSDWVQNTLRVSRRDLVLITVRGDSMEPTLSNDDLVLVDMSKGRFEDNAVYVLQHNGDLLVKRVQRRLDNTVVIKSDNERYEPEIVHAQSSDELNVVGRVVWAGRAM